MSKDVAAVSSVRSDVLLAAFESRIEKLRKHMEFLSATVSVVDGAPERCARIGCQIKGLEDACKIVAYEVANVRSNGASVLHDPDCPCGKAK
jgi:hypothetical protein